MMETALYQVSKKKRENRERAEEKGREKQKIERERKITFTNGLLTNGFIKISSHILSIQGLCLHLD